MGKKVDSKGPKRFVIEVSGPEDSRPGDDDNWFWQIGPDDDSVIDEMLPIFNTLNKSKEIPPDADV